MKIDKNLHISFAFENQEGNPGEVYIDYIDKRRFDAFSPCLGKIYTNIRSGEFHPDVFAVDWPVLLKDYPVEPFIEHVLSSAEIAINGKIIPFAQSPKKLQEQLEKNGIDDEVLTVIKGLLLFIFALLRYTTAKSLTNVKGLFTTYRDAQEWKSLHITSTEKCEDPVPSSQENVL